MVVSNHTPQPLLPNPEIDVGQPGKISWFGFCCGERSKPECSTRKTDDGDVKPRVDPTIAPERTYSWDYSSEFQNSVDE
jgi:hypothetical protein